MKLPFCLINIYSMRKKLVTYTLSSPFKLILQYADIREVVWNQAEILSVKIKNYWRPDSEFVENIVFKYPKIPSELMAHIKNHREVYQ